MPSENKSWLVLIKTYFSDGIILITTTIHFLKSIQINRLPKNSRHQVWRDSRQCFPWPSWTTLPYQITLSKAGLTPIPYLQNLNSLLLKSILRIFSYSCCCLTFQTTPLSKLRYNDGFKINSFPRRSYHETHPHYRYRRHIYGRRSGYCQRSRF